MSTPVIATHIEEVRRFVADARRTGRTVGLAPTMGALHAGHASLFRRARAEHGCVVASIFVNPTQFGPNEDFHRYPRPFEDDVALCAAEGVDLIFRPEPAVLYPPGYQTFVEVTELGRGLCGASRPTHFRGVATVVLKLFNIVQPDVAYFGQKDAQQARLLERMAADLDVPVRLAICPIVREPDGLAMSSRNRYLDPEQRRRATVLHHALEAMRNSIEAGERSAATLTGVARALVQATPGAELDYAEIVSWDDLKPVDPLRGRILAAIAVRFGATRLIDNVRIDLDA